jgi:ABC-type amino acid transport substrate-binding protein/heat shock protein HslJ
MTTPSQPTLPDDQVGKKRSPWALIGLIAAIIILAGLVWALIGRKPAAPAPSPTAIPTVSDAVCDRVDSSGKIIVGTSGDYPPFEYYQSGRSLDGFDIAVMNQIGLAMGKQIEYRDYAFDGLLNAVQLGEVDAAIAAITVTTDRQSVVDFSDSYYFGRGAVLVLADAGITGVTSAADLAGKRVGVERGTVYQSWAEANLVEAGVIPESDLFAYEKAEHAVNDLQLGRLDVVLLDDQAAASYAADSRLAVAGEGPVAQTYAIALPKGADCWRARLNMALTILVEGGFLAEDAKNYLGAILQPIPSPTLGAPAPTATPAVCVDSSEYVQDLTYDDQNGKAPPTVQPGQKFTKGWRLRNSGTCTWTSSYSLDYVGGNNKAAQMDGDPVNVVGQVTSGQTYDFYVDLTAPSGVYGQMIGRWQMFNPVDQAFGQTVFVDVIVVSPTPGPSPTKGPTVTSTPPPTDTPQPTAVPPTATNTLPPAPTATATLLTPTPFPDPLEGKTFGFYAINGIPTIPTVIPSLSFEEDGTLTGSDGCNTFEGTYTIQVTSKSQGELAIDVGIGTNLACPEDVMTQAQDFRTGLSEVTAYSYPPKGTLLSLLDQEGSAILDGDLQ